MGKENDKFKAAVASKKIPIVTLDNKWHKLWTMIEKPSDVLEKENKLNELLRRQGKLNTESKEIKKLKKKMMDEIVTLMDNADSSSEKKVNENKRLIEDCNTKLEQYEEELADLPNDIYSINREIMFETMDQCYNALHVNEKDIDELAEWIAGIRVELKKNVVRKQEMEIQNAVMYSYMHDIFGADVVDLFDMKYNPLEKMLKLKAAKEEQNANNNTKPAEKNDNKDNV